jgi:hypothetical protein
MAALQFNRRVFLDFVSSFFPRLPNPHARDGRCSDYEGCAWRSGHAACGDKGMQLTSDVTFENTKRWGCLVPFREVGPVT